MEILDQIRYYSALQFGSLRQYTFQTFSAVNPLILYHSRNPKALILLILGAILSIFQFRMFYAIFPLALLFMEFKTTSRWFWLSILLYYLFYVCSTYGFSIYLVRRGW